VAAKSANAAKYRKRRKMHKLSGSIAKAGVAAQCRPESRNRHAHNGEMSAQWQRGVFESSAVMKAGNIIEKKKRISVKKKMRNKKKMAQASVMAAAAIWRKRQ